MRGGKPSGAPAWVAEDSENAGRVLDVETAHGFAIADENARKASATQNLEALAA
jgi:hypothetical protein